MFCISLLQPGQPIFEPWSSLKSELLAPTTSTAERVSYDFVRTHDTQPTPREAAPPICPALPHVTPPYVRLV